MDNFGNQNRPDELIHSQFEYALSVIDKCTDDYIFILDFKADTYTISKSAVKRFALPSAKFSNVTQILKKVIHPDDFEMINNNLSEIFAEKTTEHNFEYRWKNADDDYVWISCRGQVVLDNDKKPAYLIGRIAEIGALKRADNVTGLLTNIQLNKDYRLFNEKNGKLNGYFMRLRINNFKELSHRYGLSETNNILKIFAKILEASAINKARIYRYENSSFIIFDYCGGKLHEAEITYENIKRAIENASKKNDYKIFFTVSAGLVEISEENPIDIDELYKKSEYALYCAEKDASNNMIIFNEEEYQNYIKKLDIQENLRIDINNNFKNFELYYQPVISLETKKIVGAEALLRWESKHYGRVSPAEFIPILEESGLIVPLGKWIFRTAIKQCKFWQEYMPEFKMNINVSYVQLRSSDLSKDVSNYIHEIGLDPKYIVIEITESGHLDMNQELTKEFYEKNFKLAIDDFGTGYSNMRYLQDLNVNILKIDRTFVERATKNEYDFKIVKHIIDMAHSINLEVCLEGIETPQELNTFEALNPNFIQGFYFGKPVPKDTFFECNIKPQIKDNNKQ